MTCNAVVMDSDRKRLNNEDSESRKPAIEVARSSRGMPRSPVIV
jgi:hypothetical protein